MAALFLFSPAVALSQTKRRGGSFFSCVQRWLVAEHFLFLFFLNETITLFIANKCWHLKGAAAGDRKKKRVRGRAPMCSRDCLWCYLTTVPCPWGSPPENKVCISINQLLMKAFGLRKKLARGYNVHVFHLLQQSVSEVEVNDKIFQFTALMNQRT